MKRYPLIPTLLAICLVNLATAQTNLIPRPAALSLTQGTMDLQCPLSVRAGSEVDPALVELIRADLELTLSPSLQECMDPNELSLDLIRPDTLLPPEWYSLTVTTKHIALVAVDEAGLYRGSRTLAQLFEEGRTSTELPCMSITDSPRFPWRGMHLDASRHFWTVEFTKKYIDLLARYKMNSFHWHLTDDQGWRIEIKKHPKLTEVGAWRKGSQVGPYSRREYDSTTYGGFYTQDQIKEVVAYAKARYINVVPEIEMPGHALAALAAYPELGCTGGHYEVNKGWGVFEEVFCAGNDSTVHFLEDVLTEVMALFPSEIIHIGGDECPKESWKKCPKCQARMKAKGLEGRARTAERLHPAHRGVREQQRPEDHRLGRDPGRWAGAERGRDELAWHRGRCGRREAEAQRRDEPRQPLLLRPLPGRSRERAVGDRRLHHRAESVQLRAHSHRAER